MEYSNSSPSKYFDVGTGSKGYVTTEEECMDSCKDDCLGYFMIPNQFKGRQPYCLQLGVNSHAIKDNKIDLQYSCSPGKFSSPSALNTMVSPDDIYGRIKTNISPLLYGLPPSSNTNNYYNIKINLTEEKIKNILYIIYNE